MKNTFLVNIFMNRQFLKLLPAIAVFIATSAMAQEINQNEIWLGTEAYARYAELAHRIESVERDVTKIAIERLAPLCLAYSRLKQYDKLFPCIQELEVRVARNQAIAPPPMIFAGPTDFSPLSKMLSAEALLELGDYRKSIAEGEVALSRVQEQVINGVIPSIRYKSTILSNLAIAAMLDNDRPAALKYVQILELTPLNTVGGWALYSQMKENSLARAKMALGDCEGALADIRAGMASAVGGLGALFMRSGGESIDNLIDIARLMIRGKCLLQANQVEEARQALDQLLANRRTAEQGEIFWLALFERGRIAEADSKPADAIQFYARAVDVIERQRATINTEVSKIGFVGDKQSVYARLIALLVQQDRTAEAFDYVERSKSRALVDMLASKRDFAVKGGNEQEIKIVLAMNDSADAEAIIHSESIDKNKTRSIQIKAREDLKTKSPELASLLSVTSQPIADLQSFIPKEEALIEYYYRDKDMYAFILSDGRLKTVKLDSEGLTDDVQAFRKLIDTPASTHFMDMSRKLYKRLFQPLECSLDKKNLIIVSHGVLHYLPMYALFDGNGYLIDRYSIRMMPSASAMKYLSEKKTTKGGSILIFGNPDLGDPQYDLEYAQNEATEVARIRPKSKVFVRKEATEEMLRKYSKNYSYFHFATHGQFNPDAPLKSALLLASDAKYNGMLTVDKIYSLSLDADLVTLSACETGLSKIANGDDLLGLTRGFLYAGSSSIVASLWKVDDLATSQLMTTFYSKLDKTNKRDALRKAQLETKKKYPHPYYWASFQLIGNAN